MDMTKKERFIVDDAGTLIDMQTRDMFDIVEEVCPLLNELNEENSKLHIQNDFLKDENQHMRTVLNENKELKKQLESEHTMLDNAILLERTRMGQSALKQYKEAIQ